MTPFRHRVALFVAGLLSVMLAACASSVTAPAPGQAVAVAPGVYAVTGTGGVADDSNLGRIGNAGFIVGDSGVIAIDTGTSYAHGQALLAAIRTVTPLPVRVALITHTRPEFLFGGAAFRAQGIPVRMQERTARLMTARCETCLKTLRTTLGEDPLAGTEMYKPDQTFADTHELDLIGRPVRVLYFGHSSGPGDIAVYDVRSRVLFAGGLVDAGRIPDIQDSDLAGWTRALQQIATLAPAHIVPGHGPVSPPAAIGGVQTYLSQLDARVRQLVTSGSSLMSVAEDAELPDFAAWDQYDIIHRRNASIAFIRVEREAMFKQE